MNAIEKLRRDISNGKVKTIIVWRLDRISPKLRDGIKILSEWSKMPLRIAAANQDLDFKGGPDQAIGSVLGSLTETASHYVREYTINGLKVGRARGRLGGRPPLSADDPKVLKVKKLNKSGRLSQMRSLNDWGSRGRRFIGTRRCSFPLKCLRRTLGQKGVDSCSFQESYELLAAERTIETLLVQTSRTNRSKSAARGAQAGQSPV